MHLNRSLQCKIMGFIYKITCNISGECYFGQSIRTAKQRLSDHKGKNNECASKLIIDRGDYTFKIVEDNIEDAKLNEREHFYIINNECVNKNIPYCNITDRYERTLSYQNKKYKENDDYRQRKIEYQSQYYKDSKDLINMRRNLKFICQCGILTSSNNKARHEKSKKHQLFLISNNIT